MTELNDTQLLNLAKSTAEKHGCKLVDVDFENHILNFEGSPDVQMECAMALTELLG